MEYQILNKKFRLNKEKNIGSVLYIVEGEKREINLLGYIFKEILEYDEVIGIDRTGKTRIKYISKENRNSKVFIINSEKNNGKSREDLRLLLENENIESRPLWKPMHLQPLFADKMYFGVNIAETLFNNGLCLPSGSNLTDDDKERINKVIKKLIE